MSKTETFTISPSEALLLGLCIGEYRSKQVWLGEEVPRFFDILKQRVSPHIPTFATWQKVNIAAKDIPVDVTWHDGEIGISPTNPGRLYSEKNGEHYYYNFNQQRRSFFDLLVSSLQASLELNIVERFVYSDTDYYVHSDAPLVIEQSASRLVAENQLTDIHDAGRQFGRLLAEIDRFDNHLLEVAGSLHESGAIADNGPQNPGESNRDYLRRSVGTPKSVDPMEIAPPLTVTTEQLSQRLKQTGIVTNCYYAQSALNQISDLHFHFDESDLPDPMLSAAIHAFSQSRDARMCLWLAFGHVLGVLHDADCDFKERDANSAVPRAFRIDVSDTPDDVLKQVRIVERDLSNKKDFDPKDTIVRLSFLTEAIAKRVWPNENWKSQGVSLARILSNKLNDPRCSAAERRFASIGLTLNGPYRNGAAHNFATTKYSVEEARFFIAAIRVLIDLWAQTTQHNKP